MPRLDQVLVTQGLADSRAHAQRLIGDGDSAAPAKKRRRRRKKPAGAGGEGGASGPVSQGDAL